MVPKVEGSRPSVHPTSKLFVTPRWTSFRGFVLVYMIDDQLKELLDAEISAMNRPEFVDDDPVRFPRMFDDLRDIEITALLVSSIAWGKRSMILRDAERMLAMMDWQPYRYTMERGYEELPDHYNIHRTFFTDNLVHFLRGLRLIYSHYDSLDAFASANGVGQSEYPSWKLASMLNAAFAEANNGRNDSRCLPLSIETTALKRLNMALRWLVRNDGIVDLGVWHAISPDMLYIPLDVHVANVSRGLGLLTRKSNDRRAVIELTEALRRFNAVDPVVYDFALFGIGVTGRQGDCDFLTV